MSKCEKCKVMQEIKESKGPSCCIWYMDNIVCGNKSVKECPEYKKKGAA